MYTERFRTKDAYDVHQERIGRLRSLVSALRGEAWSLETVAEKCAEAIEILVEEVE